MDPLTSRKATKDDESMSRKGVVASSSAMAGEETVRRARGEAAKEKKQSRDEAKAKSQQDDAADEVVKAPEAEEVMFSPTERANDEEDQSVGQDDDEDQYEDQDENDDQSDDQEEEQPAKKPGWSGLQKWLPESFGVYKVKPDSSLKVKRPKGLPPRRSTLNPKLKAKLKALEKEDDEEEKGKVFTFSPGPSQVVSTQMQKLIEEEIRQRVDDELKKRESIRTQLDSETGCRKPMKLTS